MKYNCDTMKTIREEEKGRAEDNPQKLERETKEKRKKKFKYKKIDR